MPNRNARVIIPFTIVVWLLSLAIMREGAPVILKAMLVTAFAVAVPIIVFYLMAEMGWSSLASRHRAEVPFSGRWRICPAGRMSRVSVEHPDYGRNQLRTTSALRVGVGERALHLSLLFSKVPLLGRFFPELAIPWSAVRSARPYRAEGWFRQDEPGALWQARYDPNYTGTFVELAVGEPPVFLQVPAGILGEGLSRLPPAPAAPA